MSNNSVDLVKGATDMHFGVKLTFTPHNPSERIEFVFCFLLFFFFFFVIIKKMGWR